MTIKNANGEKTTPKRKAQELLMDAISMAIYRLENDDDMTEREEERVMDHMAKQRDRVARMFGFEEGWWN